MTSDVSVRLGWADDAPALADVQMRAWRARYAGVLPADVLDSLDRSTLTASWAEALRGGSDARQRVLVALDRATVVGYVLTSPAVDSDCDPIADGEMIDLEVDPDRREQGHGSRLMQAAVDTLVSDRFTHAVTWLGTTDDTMRNFLTEAGWTADGAHRTLDLTGDGATLVKQVRLHVSIG